MKFVKYKLNKSVNINLTQEELEMLLILMTSCKQVLAPIYWNTVDELNKKLVYVRNINSELVVEEIRLSTEE